MTPPKQSIPPDDFGAVWERDRVNSISSEVGQTTIDGHRSVVVRTHSAKVQIGAFLDVLDLHLADPQSDHVTVCLVHPAPEAVAAIHTLISAMVSGPSVDLRVYGEENGWEPSTISDWDVADSAPYAGWPDLLKRVTVPPALVKDIVAGVGLAQLRAYPMLTVKGSWSLRLEGLEVGQIAATHGKLGVGKDVPGAVPGVQRQAWLHATGTTGRIDVPADGADTAAGHIRAFADHWLRASDKPHQTEHALESRILRGAVPIAVGGQVLSLIRPDDGIVNWGSQFPTKWGPSRSTRYLDAILRDGVVPWAIEMKVEGPAGVGSYYRHAVAQAVLYREFIRGAKALHFWFDALGLDATRCRAAVVVPTIGRAKWRSRLGALCHAFDVSLIEVNPDDARSR